MYPKIFNLQKATYAPIREVPGSFDLSFGGGNVFDVKWLSSTFLKNNGAVVKDRTSKKSLGPRMYTYNHHNHNTEIQPKAKQNWAKGQNEQSLEQ